MVSAIALAHQEGILPGEQVKVDSKKGCSKIEAKGIAGVVFLYILCVLILIMQLVRRKLLMSNV